MDVNKQKILNSNTKTKATPKEEALKKADELRATKGYMNGSLKLENPAKYKWVTKEISRLMQIAYPPVSS